MTYSAVRADLAKTMDQVCDDHKPVVVPRRNGKSVVIVSLEDYESLDETAYLVSSPANAKRLQESIASARAGKVVEQELID